MTKKTTSGYDGDYSKGNMGTPSFIEKYPEFKGKIGEIGIITDTVEEILDKHFIRQSEVLPSGEYVKKERYDKFKQKVRYTIDTYIRAWWESKQDIPEQSKKDVEDALTNIKKELGLMTRTTSLREEYEKFRTMFMRELSSIGLDHRLDELEGEIFEDFEKRFKMESWDDMSE